MRVIGRTDPPTYPLLITRYLPFALDGDSHFEFHRVLLILSFHCDFPDRPMRLIDGKDQTMNHLVCLKMSLGDVLMSLLETEK